MSEFHRYVTNESSDDSEDGQINEDINEFECNPQNSESNPQMFDSNALKISKSLEIVDKKTTKRKNRFSIWSDILLEEELNQSVSNSMDIKKRRMNSTKLDRNSENYSFWTKRQFEDNSDKRLVQNTINSDNSQSKKPKNKAKKNIKKSEIKVDFVAEIGHKLNEPKVELLRRVCQTIGEQKTSELCSAALDIESAGGLMTMDGKRRRTSGGVFFHLLKNDSNVSKEKIDFIFLNEQKVFKNNRKSRKRGKQQKFGNKKTNQLIKSEDNIIESMATEPQDIIGNASETTQ